MTKDPQVSVVMGVKDDEDHVALSIESILSQSKVDFEFIIINDGSRDKTGQIIAEYQRADDRIKIIEQSPKGLTRALIAGCKRATGKYIARQDAGGDISLPGRLRAQYDILERDVDAVMIGSGTRFVGPAGEHLYDTIISQTELDRGFESLSMTNMRGPPSHCSTMFRNSAYRRIGGYRNNFYVGQDLDLWLRLYETGGTLADETIRYVARVRPTDISSLYRKDQIRATKIILEAARLRRLGHDDGAILDRISKTIQDKPTVEIARKLKINNLEANGLYHIGACIKERNNERARHYFRLALRKQPFHLRALIRFASTYFAARN